MLKLAIKNLKHQKVRTIITTFGITIGIASLVIFVALSTGLKNSVYETLLSSTPLKVIDVLPNVSGNRALKLIIPGKGAKLSKETINEIKKIDHITDIYPEYTLKIPISIEGKMFGQSLITDALIMSVDEEYIKNDLPKDVKWKSTDDYVPFIVSSQLLDIYNFTIAQTNNLPILKQTDFLGHTVQIHIGESTLLPDIGETQKIIKGKAIGFSNKVGLIGITIPTESLKEFGEEKDITLSRIHASVDSAENIEKVATIIEELGYNTDYLQKRIKGFNESFKFVLLGLSSISVIILLIAGLSILNTFLSAVKERTHSIGIMRSIGATKKQILQLFLSEAAIIGFMGGVSGFILGLFGSFLANFIILSMMPDFSSKPTSLFSINPELIFGSVIFAIILSTISAIIPAYQASRLDPIRALKG